MRRSICHSDPQAVLAGATGTCHFRFQTATTLPKGALLKFDLQNPGRDIDWERPSVSLRATRNVVWGYGPDEKPLVAREVETPDSIIPQYEFTLTEEIKSGEDFTIVLGAPPKKTGKLDAKDGTRAQTMVQRRREFLLYVDPKGKGNYGDAETFHLDIRGNQLARIRILTPSLTVRNKRFDITIRFEDEYGNLTSYAPEDTLIDLSYENLRENLSWKLYVPETGFVTLPNLYFNEPGVYRIRLINLATQEVFLSAPIKCFPDGDQQLFWGLLHGESEKVDSGENVESCFRYFRDERHLNFFGSSNPDTVEETPNEVWKLVQQNVASFNEEDRFVSFLGFQWTGESPREGSRLMIWSKDAKPLLRQKDLKANSLEKLYRTVPVGELLSIPQFTMGKGVGFDFEEHNDEFERVVEIYNAWGSSEGTIKDGNPRPISCPGRKGIKEFAGGSVIGALRRGRRFGFVAGGLDDRGIYSPLFDGDQVQYSPGLTAILTEKQTRDAHLKALCSRSCYATTGARIILGFSLSGVPMGGEASTADKPGLRVNRHLSGYVATTAPLQVVELIRNGEVLTTLDFDENNSLDFTYDDMDPLEKVSLPHPAGEGRHFVFYYLRVIQEDEQMAWSSPIWVDHTVG
jgi:hypothetical protein